MEMTKFMSQAIVDGLNINYCTSRSLDKVLLVSLDELEGIPFRILGFNGTNWLECLVRGSLKPVENNDFRVIEY